MKYLLFYFILSSFTLYLTSCEKAELQQSPIVQSVIEPRAPCDDCDECCCSVLLTSGSNVEIYLCGTTNTGTTPCEFETDFCEVVNGTLHSFNLQMAGSRNYFCMDPNTALSIGSNTIGASVTITCQHGQLNPQSVNLTFGSPPKNYYSVNNDCEIEDDCF